MSVRLSPRNFSQSVAAPAWEVTRQGGERPRKETHGYAIAARTHSTWFHLGRATCHRQTDRKREDTVPRVGLTAGGLAVGTGGVLT